MASSVAFLAKTLPSNSVIFRKTKPPTINSVPIPPRCELMINTNHEMKFNKNLYSTPLRKSFVNGSNIPYTHELERQQGMQKVREVIRMVLSKEGWLEELIMIDIIQKLGIEHYFQEEVRAVLQRHYERFCSLEKSGTADNLHEVALRFRLLRQYGYNVIAADAFDKFMDPKGIWKQELFMDRIGLISLFEASHLSIPGEGVLDEATEFSAHLLKPTALNGIQDVEATMIANTLSNPYLRSLPKLMAKNFLCNFETYLKLFHNFEDHKYGWTNVVKDMGKMEFIMAQITHESEIAQVYSWWKKLNLNKELKLARDEPVKWYTWSLAALPNPSMAEERIELTKAISLLYIIDDIFDVYGTLEELTIFTKAVNRWELYDDIEGLPNSMKMCLKALHDTTDEMSNKIYSKHGCNPKTCFRKAWADLCNAFLVEAKWLASNQFPSSDEYLKNALVSVGVHIPVVHLFYLMGQEINTKTIQHLNNVPDLVLSMATIFRLSDDLGSAKDENQNGYNGSFIDYYKNEHKDNPEEISAQDNVSLLIHEAWKSLNKTSILSPSPFSPDFAAACFNVTRIVPMMYNYDNLHRLPSLEKHMKSFLHETLN